MKKTFISLIIAALFLTFSVTCFASVGIVPENSDGAEVVEQATTDGETATQEEYAGDTWTEAVVEYVTQHWDMFAILGYIVYKVLPKVGGIAKAKKRDEAFTNAIATYFGDDQSDKNILKLFTSMAKALEAFMNDAGATLEDFKAQLEPVKELLEKCKDAEHSKETTMKIALAVESAVDLMAAQLNELVLASPSVGAKKKAEIEAAWVEKENEIHALVETVVNEYDHESKV